MDMNLSKVWEIAKNREAWHAAIHGVKKSWTWLIDESTESQQQMNTLPNNIPYSEVYFAWY